MKRSCMMLVSVLVLGAHALGQNEVDALRYSMTETPVTGRSYGMGGAFGALGADLSSMFSNPAGIGMFKRGGIEVSLGLHDVTSSARYMGTVEDNARTRMTLNNFGLIGSQKLNNSDWKSINFGFAHGKTNNFYQNINISGISNGSTLMDQFAWQAAGFEPDAFSNDDVLRFTADLAYQTYAIDPNEEDSLNISYRPSSRTGDIHQTKSIRRTGVQGETSFGFGANYRDFLLFGMTLNFQSVRFKELSTHTEEFENIPENISEGIRRNHLSSYSYNEDLYSDGTGIGVKLGAIVIPTPWLRAGVGFHSGSRISLTETYSATMTSNEQNGIGWNRSSPIRITEYIIRTPSKWLVNAAFIMGKMGVVTADYEYTNYDRIRMNGSRTNNYNYSDENSTISAVYRGVHKVRAGMEFRLADAFYLRAGTVYQQSPFANGVGAINTPWLTYTGGLGYRSDYFFVDFAAGYTSREETYYMYSPELVDPATIRSNRFNAILSVGIKY